MFTDGLDTYRKRPSQALFALLSTLYLAVSK